LIGDLLICWSADLQTKSRVRPAFSLPRVQETVPLVLGQCIALDTIGIVLSEMLLIIIYLSTTTW